MSFMLRSKEKIGAKKRGASGVRSRPNSSQIALRPGGRSSSRTPGRPGIGQTQLLRHPVVTQQKQQRHQNQRQQRPQSNATTQQTEGDISMTSIYEDLRILEEQQKESQRKLENARQQKQKGLEQLALAESKLEELKYINGQRRAELHRHRELLSQGHRKLSETQASAAKGNDDLRNFHRCLKNVLASKRRLQSNGRKQERRYGKMNKQAALASRLVEEKQEQIKRAERARDDSKEREESLRQSIQSFVQQEQMVAQEMDKMRKEAEGVEEEVDNEKRREAASVQEIATMKEQAAIEHKSLRETVAALHSKIAEHERSKEETTIKINAGRKAFVMRQEDHHKLWHRVIELQIEEGHEPSATPSETTFPPVFDRARLEASLQMETKAAEDEAVAKKELQDSVDALRSETEKVEKQLTEANEKGSNLFLEVETALRVEGERRDGAAKLVEDLERTKTTNGGLRAKETALRNRLETENTKLIEQSEKLKLVNDKSRKTLCDEKQLLDKAESDGVALEARLTGVKTGFESKLEEAKKTAETARQTYGEVKENSDRLVEESSEELVNAKEEARKLAVEAEEVKNDITQLCNECPILERIHYNFDPNKTETEHIKASLLNVAEHCQERLDRINEIKELHRQRELEKRHKAEQEEAKRKAERLLAEKEAEEARCEAERLKAEQEEEARRQAAREEQEAQEEAKRRAKRLLAEQQAEEARREADKRLRAEKEEEARLKASREEQKAKEAAARRAKRLMAEQKAGEEARLEAERLLAKQEAEEAMHKQERLADAKCLPAAMHDAKERDLDHASEETLVGSNSEYEGMSTDGYPKQEGKEKEELQSQHSDETAGEEDGDWRDGDKDPRKPRYRHKDASFESAVYVNNDTKDEDTKKPRREGKGETIGRVDIDLADEQSPLLEDTQKKRESGKDKTSRRHRNAPIKDNSAVTREESTKEEYQKEHERERKRKEQTREKRKKLDAHEGGQKGDREKDRHKRHKDAAEKRKKRNEGSTDVPKQSTKYDHDLEEDEKRLRREQRKRHKEKQLHNEIAALATRATEPDSDAKPRDLILSFTQASSETVDEPLTDPEFSPKPRTQEKKVHWGDEPTELRVHTKTTRAVDEPNPALNTRQSKPYGSLKPSRASTRETLKYTSKSVDKGKGSSGNDYSKGRKPVGVLKHSSIEGGKPIDRNPESEPTNHRDAPKKRSHSARDKTIKANSRSSKTKETGASEVAAAYKQASRGLSAVQSKTRAKMSSEGTEGDKKRSHDSKGTDREQTKRHEPKETDVEHKKRRESKGSDREQRKRHETKESEREKKRHHATKGTDREQKKQRESKETDREKKRHETKGNDRDRKMRHESKEANRAQKKRHESKETDRGHKKLHESSKGSHRDPKNHHGSKEADRDRENRHRSETKVSEHDRKKRHKSDPGAGRLEDPKKKNRSTGDKTGHSETQKQSTSEKRSRKHSETTEQSSGIPSIERAPKVPRRRKKSQPVGASKANGQSYKFNDDFAFC